MPVISTPTSWNWLDWLLAGIVVLSTLRGLIRGLVQAVFGLAGILCGFFIASLEYRSVAAWVLAHHWTLSPQTAGVASYLVILFGVMVLFAIAGAIVRRAVHAVGLGGADRFLGAILGLVRGVLIGATIVLSMRALSPDSMVLLHSRLTSYFLAAGHAVSFVVPHALR